jgi:hypothetical protein
VDFWILENKQKPSEKGWFLFTGEMMFKICSLKSAKNKECHDEIKVGNCPGFSGGKCIPRILLIHLL